MTGVKGLQEKIKTAFYGIISHGKFRIFESRVALCWVAPPTVESHWSKYKVTLLSTKSGIVQNKIITNIKWQNTLQ